MSVFRVLQPLENNVLDGDQAVRWIDACCLAWGGLDCPFECGSVTEGSRCKYSPAVGFQTCCDSDLIPKWKGWPMFLAHCQGNEFLTHCQYGKFCLSLLWASFTCCRVKTCFSMVGWEEPRAQNRPDAAAVCVPGSRPLFLA